MYRMSPRDRVRGEQSQEFHMQQFIKEWVVLWFVPVSNVKNFLVIGVDRVGPC